MEMSQSRVEKNMTDELIEHGLVIPSGINGVYGRGSVMQDIITQVDNFIKTFGRNNNTEVMMFPPVMNRNSVLKNGYMKSFPNLLGSVHAFSGGVEQHSHLLKDIENCCDWSHHLSMTDVVLTPAACYPVYPSITGRVPEWGRLIEVASYCFRHEPSQDPARMQTFYMHEFVRVGSPETVKLWRDEWIERGQQFLRLLGLEPDVTPANDPFFGAGGRLLKANQKDQGLKYELVVKTSSEDKLTAVISCNYHQDHFAAKYEILTFNGEVAHTACIGFGVERIVLALFAKHGLDPAKWPSEVRKVLWP